MGFSRQEYWGWGAIAFSDYIYSSVYVLISNSCIDPSLLLPASNHESVFYLCDSVLLPLNLASLLIVSQMLHFRMQM